MGLRDKIREKDWKHDLLYRFRVSIIDEEDWTEKKAFHFSRLLLAVFIFLALLLSFLLFFFLFFFTPLRSLTTDHSKEMNQQLLVQVSRLDSMGTILEYQTNYVRTISKIVAGEIDKDSLPTSLDSMQLIVQEQLLEAKNEAIEDFMLQYEQKERDNISLFEMPKEQNSLLFRPMTGVVASHFSLVEKRYRVRIEATQRTNVCSVLNGIVVNIGYEMNNGYTVTLMHNSYVSIYYRLDKVVKAVGEMVEIGETIAFINEGGALDFEIWQNNSPIDPESLIVF